MAQRKSNYSNCIRTTLAKWADTLARQSFARPGNPPFVMFPHEFRVRVRVRMLRLFRCRIIVRWREIWRARARGRDSIPPTTIIN